MKIKKVFSYMGNKGRFYKEIKEIFLKSNKDTFVDLFAGGLEVPANLFFETDKRIRVNVKDPKMEALIALNKNDRVYSLFEQAVNKVFSGTELASTKSIYNNDRERFKILKENYANLIDETTGLEKEVLLLLGGVASKSKSLSSSFYSKQKMEKLKSYLGVVRQLEITTDYFNENLRFENSFIFLDPPYLLETLSSSKGKKGFNYEGTWQESDDHRLVEFIKANLEKGNVFMVYGSLNNHLYGLLKANFKGLSFEVREYKRSMFGHSTNRSEWFTVIK